MYPANQACEPHGFSFCPGCEILALIKAKQAEKERKNVRAMNMPPNFEHVIGFCAFYVNNTTEESLVLEGIWIPLAGGKATSGREHFQIRNINKKIADSKISGYVKSLKAKFFSKN